MIQIVLHTKIKYQASVVQFGFVRSVVNRKVGGSSPPGGDYKGVGSNSISD